MRPALVFIHLGTSVPKYLAPNIRRTLKLFPSLEVCLAGNSNEIESFAAVNKLRFLPVSAELGDPKAASSAIRRSALDSSFWGGYWQKTLDRLIAFDEIHRRLGDRPLIHIESDVILMPGFPFEEVAKSRLVSWVGHSDDVDIASIVYSPSISESSWFSSKVVEVAGSNPSLTDMHILRRIRIGYPERVDLFPPLPAPEKPSNQWVFDGSQFGDWLFGHDPHAHWGVKKRRLKTTSFSTEFENYWFHINQGQLEVHTPHGVGTVANLHVHSKELRFFREDIEEPLLDLLGQVGRERSFYGFDLRACFAWSKSRFRRWSRSALRLSTWKRVLTR